VVLNVGGTRRRQLMMNSMGGMMGSMMAWMMGFSVVVWLLVLVVLALLAVWLFQQVRHDAPQRLDPPRRGLRQVPDEGPWTGRGLCRLAQGR
jgi:uncharacterized membrane protein